MFGCRIIFGRSRASEEKELIYFLDTPDLVVNCALRETSVSGAVSGMRIRPENSFAKIFVELARMH
jgi:hypothetical protein